MADDAEARKSTGFFAKLKSRLNRGKTWLTGDLFGLFGKGLDEEALEDFEERLLSADVGVDVTNWLIDRLRKTRASSGDSAEAAVKSLRSALMELLGPVEVPLEVKTEHRPFVILAVGVNGTGKTTTLGKLAHRLRDQGYSVLLAAGDTFRAAAVEQLQEWGERSGIAVVAQAPGADPAAVVHDALAAARARRIDVVLADTAGRLHTSGGLMDELDKIKRVIGRFDASAPHEVLLVVDASQGQNALAQATEFHHRLGVTGLVITKLDGTAKGGIVLAIARKLGVPVRFLAVGEGIDDLDVFRAEQFIGALLGGADWLIRFENVHKRYPSGREALRGISFELERGDMAFLTGPSGAGKSTLLKLITLIEKPTRGTVLVNHQNTSRVSRRRIPRFRQKVGVVFQDHKLLYDRSVFDNVALPLVIIGLGPREIARRVRASLDQVGLLGRERHAPITLSTGEQQRVGIARAVASRPDVVIADEPTGNLDPELSLEIMRLFERFNEVGVTLLIATHDLELIDKLNRRRLRLVDGQIEMDTPRSSGTVEHDERA